MVYCLNREGSQHEALGSSLLRNVLCFGEIPIQIPNRKFLVRAHSAQ